MTRGQKRVEKRKKRRLRKKAKFGARVSEKVSIAREFEVTACSSEHVSFTFDLELEPPREINMFSTTNIQHNSGGRKTRGRRRWSNIWR